MGKETKSRRTTVWVRTPRGKYPVFLQAGILQSVGGLVAQHMRGAGRTVVVSTSPVWRRWGRHLLHGFGQKRPLGVLLMEEGETSKRLATVEKLAERMVPLGADREAVLLAFGGGVVGDTSGFLAASYMRGIAYAQIPTTLMAQVDSSIGAKTGVNLTTGKNLLGAFHQPLAVFTDPQVLSTLPEREFQSGLYEVVKSAILRDPYLFRYLESHMEEVQRRDPHALQTILVRCIRLKARIVSKDERESGARRLLNLGHTFGHAFESLGNYRLLRHGEAVGWGLLAATKLSQLTGRLSQAAADRIEKMVLSVGPLPKLPAWPPGRIYERLFADKKKKGGQLYFVLPRGIGRAEIVGGLPRRAILDSLSQLSHMRQGNE